MEVKRNGRTVAFAMRSNPWKNLTQCVAESNKFHLIERNGGMITTVFNTRHETLDIPTAIILEKILRSLVVGEDELLPLFGRRSRRRSWMYSWLIAHSGASGSTESSGMRGNSFNSLDLPTLKLSPRKTL